jgi:hypothetical protein
MSRVFYEPQKLTVEQLEYLKLADLDTYIREMEAIKSSAVEHNYDPKKWEVELAYALRVRENKISSLEAHARYLDGEALEAAKFAAEEELLPPPSFSN